VWPNLSLHITSFRLRAWYANTLERRNYPNPNGNGVDQLGEGTAEGEGLADGLGLEVGPRLPLGAELGPPLGAELGLAEGSAWAG